MSLGQLTANYTDSEGEEDDKNKSRVDADIENGDSNYPKNDMKEDSPSNDHVSNSVSSTPQKKVNRLVSYYNEDDDDEDGELKKNDDEVIFSDIEDEPDEVLHSEPMDTGTDDEVEERSTFDYGIKLPLAPPGKCSAQLQERIAKCLKKVRHHNKDYNAIIQSKKEFRNPSIYEKLIDLLQLDEFGSNYPLDMFDPHCWGKESYYTELAKVQREEMEKREKERKEKTKVDIISGTKRPSEEEAKKRKSRFDQPASVLPPTLTSVPSGTKPTIDAFGGLARKK